MIIYLNSDEEFMATFLLESDDYVADSKKEYDELKPFVIDDLG